MNMGVIKTKVGNVSEKRSYLCDKKLFITISKWLGYFPIKTNSELTEFQMKAISWPFILHVMRASIILFFYTSLALLNVHPTLIDYTHISHKKLERNETENLLNNKSFFQISYKYDFRSVTDYSHLILYLSYVLIVSILFKPLARYLTLLSKTIGEFDEETPKKDYQPTKGCRKLYGSVALECLVHSSYLFTDTLGGIRYPDWWRKTMVERLYVIFSAVSTIWIFITQVLIEVVITTSFLAIKQRLRVMSEKRSIENIDNSAIYLLVKILEAFQSAFGGVLTLHIAFYVVDTLTACFNAIIFGTRGDFYIVSILFWCSIGRTIRVYNLVSVCDQLSHEILGYSEHLEEKAVDISEDLHKGKVTNVSKY